MSPKRKVSLSTGNFYHVYSRSIAKFVIFNDHLEYARIIDLIYLYRFNNFKYKYTKFKELSIENQKTIIHNIKLENSKLVDIISFCIMPTHIHLVLKQNMEDGIRIFMQRILNSYSRYFNTKHRRYGPLWTGRFQSVLVLDDNQLLHLTRYIHLNPTSASLVDKPEDWEYSSYGQYTDSDNFDNLCDFQNYISINSKNYKIIVNDRKDYQKKLSLIKYLTIDDYAG